MRTTMIRGIPTIRGMQWVSRGVPDQGVTTDDHFRVVLTFFTAMIRCLLHIRDRHHRRNRGPDVGRFPRRAAARRRHCVVAGLVRRSLLGAAVVITTKAPFQLLPNPNTATTLIITHISQPFVQGLPDDGRRRVLRRQHSRALPRHD